MEIAFLLTDHMYRMINKLNAIFHADNNTSTNDEIKFREVTLLEYVLEANKLSDKLQKLLKTQSHINTRIQ